MKKYDEEERFIIEEASAELNIRFVQTEQKIKRNK